MEITGFHAMTTHIAEAKIIKLTMVSKELSCIALILVS